MEKTTKKRKAKKKGLKKRIGLIAIGGLSLVLTVCLSVGATLAWFAGSTYSDKSLFMGGPVYVEMTGTDDKKWNGGSGNLQITSFERGMGTVDDETNILLPGQRFAIYSQARVFSTSKTNTVGTNNVADISNGANNTNTSTSQTTTKGNHTTTKGNKTTTTSSVLRARFSVSVEFDPSVGFNNFSGTDYANNYPVQSGVYMGENADSSGAKVDIKATGYAGLAWADALGKSSYTITTATAGSTASESATVVYAASSRRDAVNSDTYSGTPFTSATEEGTDKDLTAIKEGDKKSIYSWKFVSKSVYEDAAEATNVSDAADLTKGFDCSTNDYKYIRMSAPFDGTVNADGEASSTNGGSGNGYYGVWVLTEKDGSEKRYLKESDSFYKARCNAYIQTYVEHYYHEYGDYTERKVGQSLQALENALNNSFVNLVNDSSNAIIAGLLNGMDYNDDSQIMSYKSTAPAGASSAFSWGTAAEGQELTKASWLYIDPSIGNDTNTNELSTSTGGWWYLVECDSGQVGQYGLDGTTTKSDSNKVKTQTDVYPTELITEGEPTSTQYTKDNAGNIVRTNTPTYGTDFTRASAKSDSETRLTAKLFEIKPEIVVGSNLVNGSTTTKLTSYYFPFVNGSAVLAGDELTNIFANAKITVQISFQAVQAFFPFTTSIDNMNYKDTLLGTAKALNIENAIPIFNEAFDYYEDTSAGSIENL